MEPVKVLFFSPFFYPEAISTGKYNGILAQALVKRGAVVDVVASHPLYPAWKPVRSDSPLEGMSIHRGGAWVRYPRSTVLRRLVLELWFAWHATWKSWALGQHVAIAVAVFPPSLFFSFVKYLLPPSVKKTGIVHDLQGIMGLSGRGLGERLLYRLVHAVESRAFRSCDRLIVLSHGMASQAIKDYGLDKDKVVVCYPFVSVRREAKVGSSLAHLFPEQAQHVVYSGALGKKQNPFCLFEFFRAAATHFPNVHFHFFSDGPIFEALRKRHLANPMDRIRFHSLVSEVDLVELYARSTVQLIPQSERSSNACLPSKLPNILASGCVVLAICESDTELASILKQTATGVAADSWQIDVLVDKLKHALDQAKAQSREQRQALVSNLLRTQFNLKPLVDVVLGHADLKAEGFPFPLSPAHETGLELFPITPEQRGPEY